MNMSPFPELPLALIEEHTVLVKKIARHLLGRLPPSVQLDDLIQSGMIGLIEASRNYDANKGASFATFAGIRIRGAMLDEIRKGDWVPRSVHRNSRRVVDAVRKVENLTGRDAKDAEVALELGIPLEEFHEMLQDTNGAKVFGFDDIGLTDDALNGGGPEGLPSPQVQVERDKFKQLLIAGIRSLPEREGMVLSLYYDEGLNLREVGQVLGVSESRICQLHSQAMLRLKSRLGPMTDKVSDWFEDMA